jgi:exopolyphosphatase/pppGpp-phosphohydrolase
MNAKRTRLNGRVYRQDFREGPPGFSAPRSIVEMGAQSLKFHEVDCGALRTAKYPYSLGHEVYSQGRVSETTAREIVRLTRAHGSQPTVAIGTSAVRDAENQRSLVRLLAEELDLAVHVLSPWEEASLLAEGYLAYSRALPALVVDIGGGSLELVFLSKTRALIWDSLPLGAIRLHEQGAGNGSLEEGELVSRAFEKASVVASEDVYATGGTATAIARTLRRSTFDRQVLAELEADVRRSGPPADLKPHRARVFLTGIVLTRKLLDTVRAERAHLVKISVGRVFLSVARSTYEACEPCDSPSWVHSRLTAAAE